ncbi:response regulator [Leptolyngbya sp. FACHB-36]|uniref:response regulator n=1 Tax=Leptolyngbya sp. FACHB-36 TaxID=2692808 RepID=UPI00168066AD|nr:response regulator [Leptolyngbya sp. FACHB-36]MBD2020750.1 response regulator [Leptolyngbya sp. FACHB-36]
MTHFSRKVVLYVEDDSAYVLLFRRALQQSRLENIPEVHVVNTAETAIDYLSGNSPYDDRQQHPLPVLIITDLRMPGKGGMALLRWLKQQPDFQSIPTVMLTGSAEEGDIEQAYELGINFCLVKPTEAADLVNIVQALSIYWIPPPTPPERR